MKGLGLSSFAGRRSHCKQQHAQGKSLYKRLFLQECLLKEATTPARPVRTSWQAGGVVVVEYAQPELSGELSFTVAWCYIWATTSLINETDFIDKLISESHNRNVATTRALTPHVSPASNQNEAGWMHKPGQGLGLLRQSTKTGSCPGNCLDVLGFVLGTLVCPVGTRSLRDSCLSPSMQRRIQGRHIDVFRVLGEQPVSAETGQSGERKTEADMKR